MQPPPPAPCCTALLLPPPPLSSPALQLQACQSSSNPIHSPRASMDLARAAHAYLLNLDSGAAATDIRGLFTGVTPRHELMAPWGPYAVRIAPSIPCLRARNSALPPAGLAPRRATDTPCPSFPSFLPGCPRIPCRKARAFCLSLCSRVHGQGAGV